MVVHQEQSETKQTGDGRWINVYGKEPAKSLTLPLEGGEPPRLSSVGCPGGEGRGPSLKRGGGVSVRAAHVGEERAHGPRLLDFQFNVPVAFVMHEERRAALAAPDARSRE